MLRDQEGRSASEWAMVVSTTLEDIENSWIVQQDFWRLEHKNDRIIRDTRYIEHVQMGHVLF
ncbi:MAG: hypothetical protein DLM72_19765 [Candidatus Nitrosopolaris wilkensis]|nr:MAG: hypothetical protein DLM72_19765 [Candidatus Nitrosopolaris wilkensis]